jgi:hypothetical protein
MQHVSIFALKLVEFVFLLLLSRFIVIASYRTYCRCTLNLPCNAVLCSPFLCIVLHNGCVPLVLYFRSWIHGTSGMLEFALATPADATEVYVVTASIWSSSCTAAAAFPVPQWFVTGPWQNWMIHYIFCDKILVINNFLEELFILFGLVMGSEKSS